jgi:hypothetical protein
MSVSRVERDMQTLARELQSSASFSHVAVQTKVRANKPEIQVIQEDTGWFSYLGRKVVNAAKTLYNYSPLGYFCGEVSYTQEVLNASGKTTVQYFQNIFGEKRVERIDARLALGLAKKLLAKEYCTKTDIEKIVIGAAEITYEDVEEFLLEIQDESKNEIRYLTQEETAELRQELKNVRSVKSLSKNILDSLFTYLFPVKKIEHVFFHKLPLSGSWVESRLEEAKKRVFSYYKMKELMCTDPRWELFLAKELAGRALPEGVFIPHQDGFYYNFKKIEKAGELKYLLKNLGTELAHKYVLYAGTRLGDRASREENLREHIGLKGPVETYEETRSYLFDPRKGFVDSSQERLSLIGFSQGGVHAQRTAVIFPEKFQRIVTVCSPGIDFQSVRAFAGKVNAQAKKMTIYHYVEQGDPISEFGEARLGWQCSGDKVDISFAELSEKGVQKRAITRMQCPGNCWKVVFRVLSGASAHLRPMIGRTLSLTHALSNKTDYEALLEHLYLYRQDQNDQWENMRKRLIASWLLRVKEKTVNFHEFVGSVIEAGKNSQRSAYA